MSAKLCYNGAACQMQDKKTCFHACAVRVQAPVVAMVNGCTDLIGAIGRHRDAQVEALIADALKREREACIALCEQVDADQGGSIGAYFCADAIRSRIGLPPLPVEGQGLDG